MGTPHKYTADTLEEALRDTVGDPSSNPSQRWDDTECADYLNRAMAQVALHIPWEYETSWTVTMAAGTRVYLLPIDFIAEKRVENIVTADTDERTLIYCDETEWKMKGFQQDKDASGEPTHYTYLRDLGDSDPTSEQPRHIVLYPNPSAANDLKIYGFKIPEVLTAGTTEVPELPVHKLEAVIMYAGYLMMRDDRDDVRADRFLRDFSMQISLIRNFNFSATRSRAPMLKPWKNVYGGLQLPHERRVQ